MKIGRNFNLVKSFCLSFCLCVVLILPTGCSRSGGIFGRSDFRIGENIELTYYAPYWTDFGDYENAGEFPLYQELEKLTGVRIVFRHPNWTDWNSPERMIKVLKQSADMPDIIELNWTRYEPGGPAGAIADGTIERLNEHLPIHAPNLWGIILSDEETARWISTKDGSYCLFPYLVPRVYRRRFTAPLLKKAWLDAVEMDVPETIDEWYGVLTAFKGHNFETHGSEEEYPLLISATKDLVSRELDIPLVDYTSVFAGAFGIGHGYFFREGEILYGPLLPEYEEMLRKLAAWYSEGLIHPVLANPPSNPAYAPLLIKTGAWLGIFSGAPLVSNFELVAAPLPRQEGIRPIGNMINVGFGAGRFVAVSAASAYKIEAMKWLDIGYSDEGNLLYNFGVRGESYTLERGLPVLTESLLSEMRPNYEMEVPWANTLRKYARGRAGGPYVLSEELVAQYHRAAGEPLAPTEEDGQPWIYPEAVLRKYPDAFNEFHTLMTDIWQYRLQGFVDFVTGQRSFEEYPEFVRTIEEMGIHRATEILERTWREFYEKPIR